MYRNIRCKTALNRIKSNYLPYRWDLNIYRGCAHRCRYCYALYSHQYIEGGDFFNEIYIKENIVECLEKKLRSPYWKHETVNLGGVTDSYQPVEKEKKIMPEILRLLIRYRTPAAISTKSTLIMRDHDLLEKLAETAGLHLSFSITTTDEELRKKIEPASAPAVERFHALTSFRDTKAVRGVLLMPILPYLTDQEEDLRDIFQQAQKAEVNYIIPGLLNLRQPTRGHFLHFVKNVFPEKYPAYINYYSGHMDKKAYRHKLYTLIARIKKDYPLIPKKNIFPRSSRQMELF
ncbi:MAG: radical SAM protein [Fidelibacterota bacterium]